MTTNIRSGSTLFWMLALIVALTAAGSVAWWRFSTGGAVVAYLKVERNNAAAFVINPQQMSDEEHRQVKINHKALIVSPLVLDAALQRQDIANLDIVRRHLGTELMWLLNALQVSFPGDGEIMEVRMSCAQGDREQTVMIVDSVSNAYFDKVLLQERLKDATEIADFRTGLSDLEESFKADLVKLEERRESANSSEQKAEVIILETLCSAKQELMTKLKLKELMLQFEQDISERQERTGAGTSERVSVVQRAAWIDE
ncbi:hypothetical protein [Lacipirellula limnantheis]|nr:hypothetical protein [Lacipirellula limnantheis]